MVSWTLHPLVTVGEGGSGVGSGPYRVSESGVVREVSERNSCSPRERRALSSPCCAFERKPVAPKLMVPPCHPLESRHQDEASSVEGRNEAQKEIKSLA